MTKLRVGLAAAGLFLFSTIAYAAGLFPDFPVVGGATYCAGSSSTATGTITGVQTGCPNQVPAGPTVVTGNERLPADTNLGGGASPQTVLLSLASLNALPISQFNNIIATPGAVVATNTSGGVIYTTAFTFITSANITLPPAPIDGQQYRVAANHTISALNITAGGTATMGNNSNPTLLSAGNASTSQGFTFRFDAASNSWWRVQ